ncbi:efflux RND transporter permease subunit [bacterium]|nr:efflux RND transporter permease subunit [bacterium]
MNLPQLAVRRPVTVFMIYLAVALFGILAITRTPLDLYPDMEFPTVAVITFYPGAGSEDVENGVTKPIEDAVATVSGIDEITSVSQSNMSVVMANFEWGTNLDEVSNDMRSAIEMARDDLPGGAEAPRLLKLSADMAPVVVLAVSANESYESLNYIVENEIGDKLRRVPGVALVSVMGGPQRQIEVRIDPQRLQAYGISLEQIGEILAAENLDFPVGTIDQGDSEISVRVPGEFEELEQIERIVVGQHMGSLIHLGDVGDVVDDFADQTMHARLNNRPGVIVYMQKQSGSNSVEVANGIKAELERIIPTLPPDVEIELPMDSSESISSSLSTLTTAVMYGFLAVLVVVLIFLRRMRSTIVVGISIPVSFLVVIIFMNMMGYTFNSISLMSLAIAIGMVVDAAVVVLENISRHIEAGERVSEASIYAPSEVGQALMASGLTTIAVFIPMIFVTGIVGVMFNQLALIIVVTIAASLLVALTLTPALTSTFMRRSFDTQKSRSKGFFEAGERVFKRVEAWYSSRLKAALAHKGRVIIVAVLIFVGTMLLTGFLGTEFYPQEDGGYVGGIIELAPGTRLERTVEVMSGVSAFVDEHIPEREHYFSRSGQTESGFAALLGEKEGPNVAEIGIKLVKKADRDRTSFEIAEELRDYLNTIPGVLSLEISGGNPMSGAMSGGAAVEIEIYGADLAELNQAAEDIRDAVWTIEGTRDVRLDRGEPLPELHVVVDREKAASVGVNTAIVASALRSQVYGLEATRFSGEGEEWNILLRAVEDGRSDAEDILALPITTLTGQTITLAAVADLVPGTGPTVINRLDQQRIVRVLSDLHGTRLNAVKPLIEAKVAELDLPTGIDVAFGGDIEEQAESFKDLTLLLVLAVALVYIVMAAQFESFRGPFIIMFSIPFAFVGVIWAFLVTGTTLNMVSFMGMIMLMGIVVNNAIVLVDYANIMRKRGQSIHEALVVAGERRLRPVLMTAATTMFGMLPLALSRGEGAESWNPLGIAMIGGLFVSTVVTLILVPVLYSIFEGRRGRQGVEA